VECCVKVLGLLLLADILKLENTSKRDWFFTQPSEKEILKPYFPIKRKTIKTKQKNQKNKTTVSP
jgi:hypothetical protein